PTSLRAISERTLSRFTAAMRQRITRHKQPMQPISVKTHLLHVRTALRWAARLKLIPACPQLPSVKVPKKRPMPVPAESFERLLGKARDQQMRTFLLCGWLAGLRLNEALALEWAENEKAPWVDFERNRIWLPAEFVKAVEDQWVALDPTLR